MFKSSRILPSFIGTVGYDTKFNATQIGPALSIGLKTAGLYTADTSQSYRFDSVLRTSVMLGLQFRRQESAGSSYSAYLGVGQDSGGKSDLAPRGFENALVGEANVTATFGNKNFRIVLSQESLRWGSDEPTPNSLEMTQARFEFGLGF